MLIPSEKWYWHYCSQLDKLLLQCGSQQQVTTNVIASQLNCQMTHQPFSLEEAEAFWRFDDALQNVFDAPQQRFHFCVLALANRYRHLSAHKSWYFVTQRQQDCGLYQLVQLQGKDQLTALVVASDLECVECLLLNNGETLAGKLLQAGTVIRVLRNRAVLIESQVALAYSA